MAGHERAFCIRLDRGSDSCGTRFAVKPQFGCTTKRRAGGNLLSTVGFGDGVTLSLDLKSPAAVQFCRRLTVRGRSVMPKIDVSQPIAKQRSEILKQWGAQLREGGALSSGRIKEAELDAQSREFLDLLVRSFSGAADEQKLLRQKIAEISRTRAIQGFSATETATFIFSLKQPIFDALRRDFGKDPEVLGQAPLVDERDPRRARPLFHGHVPEEPRRGDHPPAEGDRRAFHPGGEAVGRHPRLAADRHARQ